MSTDVRIGGLISSPRPLAEVSQLSSLLEAHMDLSFATPCVSLIIFCLSVHVWHMFSWRSRSRGLPLPPGPRSLPVLGNFFNFPTVRPWITNLKLASLYGEHVLEYAVGLLSHISVGSIVHFRVLGQSIIVLNSADAIYELLEKRSATSSDRLQTPMIEL